MWNCARYDVLGCREGQERSPPGMRGSAYRESNGADIGGQPCGALQCLFYHSNGGNTCLIRSAIPFSVEQFNASEACAESALPLARFPHVHCIEE